MTEQYTKEELEMFSEEERAELLGGAEPEMAEEPVEQEPQADYEEPEAQEEPEQEEPPAEPVEAAPAPEQPQTPPQGYVPHQAMQQERAKRQELEKRLAELEASISKSEPEAPPQYVDPIVDPDGFRKWSEFNTNQHSQTVQQMQEAQQAAQRQAERQLEVQNYVQQFQQSQPDYMDAMNYLVQKRQNDLAAQGYGQQEMINAIQVEADQIFDAGKAAGLNPAELIYRRAQAEGYAMAAPAPAEPAPSPAPAPNPEAQRLAAQARAQQQTQGLGNAGGSVQQGRLTLKQLSEMNESEYNKIQKERPEEVLRAMGG